MKHIKHFETSQKLNKFWIIPPDQPHLKLAFKKIGMDDNEAQQYHNIFFKDIKKILVFKEKKDWSWAPYNSTEDDGIKFLEHPNYQNMGTIYITDEDAASIKYNL